MLYCITLIEMRLIVELRSVYPDTVLGCALGEMSIAMHTRPVTGVFDQSFFN